ncbi:DUF2461 domain-containing protein [Prolixibacter sp. SD074]|uniref:DUF2461 domain-containing protein n=1 Tax=Prolixibacter sp. SD074 TaxID=2652391 RepID=UPI0012992A8E|nr:DUF2461 domain-containing protein [Prolixibacter sp. SD074]
MKDILDFLADLGKNNNREWFERNRDRYEETRSKFLAFTELLNNEIKSFDPEVPMLAPKDCMFRIFRDVRFSNDKRPYKTNYGSFISRGGRKSGYAGYYLHLQPGSSFLGGGVFMPPSANLKAIRQEIFLDPEGFLSIKENPEFQKHLPDEYDARLKTAPRDFPKDWEYIHLLRNKSYAYGRNLTAEEILSPLFMENVLETFKVLSTMNQYLNQAIDDRLKS